MQHWNLLKQVEQDITSMDKDHLVRVRLLLQSDLWSANSRLYVGKNMASDQVSKFEAKRNRIEEAIGRIESRIQALL